MPDVTPNPHPHLPEPSFWPIVLALGVLLIAVGIVSSLFISAAGLLILLGALIGWTLENRVETEVEERIHE